LTTKQQRAAPVEGDDFPRTHTRTHTHTSDLIFFFFRWISNPDPHGCDWGGGPGDAPILTELLPRRP
jgi:hypothetical protein